MAIRRTWIKLYVDQTLRGTCFGELSEAERFIWFGFLLLAGDSAWPGVICATQGTGYSDEQLAELLKTNPELIKVAKKKMVKFEKITLDENGKIGIVNWHKYQSEYQRQRIWQKEYQQRKTRLLQRFLTPTPDAKIEREKENKKEIKNKYNKLRLLHPIYNKLTEEDLIDLCQEFPLIDHLMVISDLIAWEKAQDRKTKNPLLRMRNFFKVAEKDRQEKETKDGKPKSSKYSGLEE